jgi:hypothetical protein
MEDDAPHPAAMEQDNPATTHNAAGEQLDGGGDAAAWQQSGWCGNGR